jgi:hypothetical protein
VPKYYNTRKKRMQVEIFDAFRRAPKVFQKNL